MGGLAEAGAADPPGGSARGACLLLLLGFGLLVTWLVLSIFVLNLVVADAGNLAVMVAVLVVAAWRVRKRGAGHVPMWCAAVASTLLPFQLLQDLGTEHRWPAGQMHELLIAQKIGGLLTLACLAMAGRAFLRHKRRTAAARASGEPAAI
jgi:hypothetical protein